MEGKEEKEARGREVLLEWVSQWGRGDQRVERLEVHVSRKQVPISGCRCRPGLP